MIDTHAHLDACADPPDAVIARYRGGSVPEAANELADAVASLGDRVAADFDAYDITAALEVIWTFVRELNRYVERTRPWELAKDDAAAEALDRALYTLADGLRAVAVAVASYLPETAPKILRALGQPESLSWGDVAPGRSFAAAGIEAAPPLFPRIEEPVSA